MKKKKKKSKRVPASGIEPFHPTPEDIQESITLAGFVAGIQNPRPDICSLPDTNKTIQDMIAYRYESSLFCSNPKPKYLAEKYCLSVPFREGDTIYIQGTEFYNNVLEEYPDKVQPTLNDMGIPVDSIEYVYGTATLTADDHLLVEHNQKQYKIPRCYVAQSAFNSISYVMQWGFLFDRWLEAYTTEKKSPTYHTTPLQKLCNTIRNTLSVMNASYGMLQQAHAEWISTSQHAEKFLMITAILTAKRQDSSISKLNELIARDEAVYNTINVYDYSHDNDNYYDDDMI